MEFVVNEENPLVHKVSVSVPAESLRTETNRVLRELAKRVKVPGFRPGKVPMNEVRKRHLGSARADAIDAVINRSVREVLQDERFRKAVFIGRPTLEAWDESAESLGYSLTVEYLPEISEANYRDLKVRKLRVDVADDAVDAELEKARQAQATLESVEGRTTVEADDVVVLSYVGSGDTPNASELKAEDQTVELSNPDLLDGFAAGLVGAEVGVAKEVTLTMPEDFPEPSMAGTDVTLAVTISEIRKRIVPELDDELAKSAGDADTLADWRANVRASLEAAAERDARRDAMMAAAKALREANTLEFPPGFLNEEATRMAENRLKEFSAQGLDAKKLGITPQMLAPRMVDEVKSQLSTELLLSFIAKSEEIVVDDEVIDAFLQRIADDRGEPLAKVRAQYSDDRQRTVLQANLLLDRALERVLELADVELVDTLAEPEADGASESGDDDTASDSDE